MIVETIETVFEWLTWILPRPLTVMPNERGVLVRKGKIVREAGPGWVWIWPPIDELVSLVVVAQIRDIRAQSVTTSDDKCLAISGAVSYKICNATKAAFRVNNFDDSLETLCLGILAHYVNQRKYADCRKVAGIVEEIKLGIREKATDKWGVQILDVWITDIAIHKVIRVLGDGGVVPMEEEEEDE